MLLSDEERKRFIEYLTVEINSATAIYEQLQKMNISQALNERESTIIKACKIVRERLLNVELQIIQKVQEDG